MQTLLQDLRYGLRMLMKSPGFTAAAVLTLGLGIGANTAIFQLIDAIRLRSIPVNDPQGLATVRIVDRTWASGNFNGPYAQLSFPLWQQIQKRQESFSTFAAWGNDTFNLATGGEVHNVLGLWVSGDFFRTLGIQPLLGRLISSSDDQPGCGSGGVDISYAFWQRQYGGQASAIGKKLTLEGHPFEIIGITPPAFYGVAVGQSFDVAIPICSEPVIISEDSRLTVRRSWWLASVGRLKPGWSFTQATAQMAAITPAALQETIPPEYDAEEAKRYLEYKLGTFPASTGFSELRKQSEAPLWLLLGISGLVLLIACANLANLMLARASARGREIALRLALGASRGRLIRQLLSESLLLAVIGAAVGVLFAVNLSALFIGFISTQNNPVALDLVFDWRVLGFTATLALLTTMLFGLAPTLRATGAAPSAVLKTGGRGMTASRERFGLRRILVISQVALSLVLLVGALLFVRSLRNLLTLDPGFQQNGVLNTYVNFTRLNIPAERRWEFKRDLLDRLRSLPGVESVADVRMVPVSGSSSNTTVIGNTPDQKLGVTWLNIVGAGYFKTLQTPLLAGRDFDDRDTAASPKVAIVNEAFVRKFMNAGAPVGKTFRVQQDPGKPDRIFEIVGLVKDSKYVDLHEEFLPTAYLASAQETHSQAGTSILIRSNAPLAGLISSVKRAIGEVSPEIDIEFRVFKTTIRESLLQDELVATLSGFFGLLAALLAAIGLYGVISYMVSERTNEIGIRMALGAQREDVLKLIMREAVLLLAVGLVVGTVLALASARAASSLLFGLKARDPLTLAIALVTLSAVAALASFMPAYRASRLDPMVALHYE